MKSDDQSKSGHLKQEAFLGALLVFISAIAFSAKAIFIKLAYAYYPIDPTTLLALRMLIAIPFVLTMIIYASRYSSPQLNLRDWALIAGLGLSGIYYHRYLTLQA